MNENISRLNFDGVRVLFVEDNPISIKITLPTLEKHRFKITIANNGLEAYDLFKQLPFDIILMDCEMPIMDGFEATKRIIAYQKNHNLSVPIIALTGNTMESDKQKCLQAGMKAFISKPFAEEKLMSTMGRILADCPRTQFMGDNSDFKKENVILDHQILRCLKETMEDDFIELVPAFLSSAQLLLSRLREAQSEENFQAMQINAHSLKSSSANMGALTLSDLAKTIEDQCRKKQLVDINQIKSMENVFDLVKVSLKEFSDLEQ